MSGSSDGDLIGPCVLMNLSYMLLYMYISRPSKHMKQQYSAVVFLLTTSILCQEAVMVISCNIYFRTFQAHEATIFGCCCLPDNQYLVSGSGDGDLT